MDDDMVEGRPGLMAFPARTYETVRVDSVPEEYAYLHAYPTVSEPWSVVSQTLRYGKKATIDEVIARDDVGQEISILFDVTNFHGSTGTQRLEGFTTEYLDRLMQRAAEFARLNPPHHPGSLPRFPVPSARYSGRIDVPLAVLAVDAGRRGLYAPPRVVTLNYPGGDPFGVGEYPGFDPTSWPPLRLGDWPPPTISRLDRLCLEGSVARLSACATRLMDAWFEGAAYPQLADEAAELLILLARLDLPAMLPVYKGLSPAYIGWIQNQAEMVGQHGKPGGQ